MLLLLLALLNCPTVSNDELLARAHQHQLARSLTAMETITLPHLPQHRLQLALFTQVRNATFLRQQLLDGNTEFEYAFLDASVIVSRTHVLAACFRAINDLLHNRLKSRNVHSEIVFSLSPNNNVCPVMLRSSS